MMKNDDEVPFYSPFYKFATNMMKQKSINQLFWCILSAIAGVLLGFYFDFFTHVGPDMESVKDELCSMSRSSESIDMRIKEIKDYYIKRDEEGCACAVGVSSEMEGNYVSVYKGNKLNLKSGDIIYITNPYGKFTPTVKFVVYFIDENTSNKSTADLYVSRAGIDKLDISPREVKRKGVFNMTMLRPPSRNEDRAPRE